MTNTKTDVTDFMYAPFDSVAELPGDPANVRDQRRRAVGAPLADRTLPEPLAVPASGVTTRDDRCIA
jgi:hypothetical protein